MAQGRFFSGDEQRHAAAAATATPESFTGSGSPFSGSRDLLLRRGSSRNSWSSVLVHGDESSNAQQRRSAAATDPIKQSVAAAMAASPAETEIRSDGDAT
ncbi:hypothetical protein MRB53_027001 [Persea americana]|uniref:Uncharacterized protein n=1 Tax=Persea americana TaxID=3435 RepID=A0ACC2LK68_PERAE|nr:hypothetical protein MRB53_027001 [Persea americana]